MKTKLLPMFEEKIMKLTEDEQHKFSHVLQKIEVCDSFEEVDRLFSPVVAKLKDMKVFMIKVTPAIRATFTINDNILYFVSLIDKRDT